MIRCFKHGLCHITYSAVGRRLVIIKVETHNGFRNEGHAKRALKEFFKMAREDLKSIDVGTYTADGERFIRKIFERLSQETGVQIHHDQMEFESMALAMGRRKHHEQS